MSSKSESNIHAIADALRLIKGNKIRTFDSACGRMAISKRAALVTMQSEVNRVRLMDLVGDIIDSVQYHPPKGYVASRNGPFGHYRHTDRRGEYVGAYISISWKK